MANAPDRYETYLLADGESKLTWAPDTRIPQCATFTFNREDHTLANLLRSQLLKNPAVIFAAYRVPHPLFSTFELRVQTTMEGIHAGVEPKDAVAKACQEVMGTLQLLSNNFTREWELRKMIDH